MHYEANHTYAEALADTEVLRAMGTGMLSSEYHFSLDFLESAAAGMVLVKRGWQVLHPLSKEQFSNSGSDIWSKCCATGFPFLHHHTFSYEV